MTNSPGTTDNETDYPPTSSKHKSVVEHHQMLGQGTNEEEIREEEASNGRKDPVPDCKQTTVHIMTALTYRMILYIQTWRPAFQC